MDFHKDYYKALGITRKASLVEIKAAYRRLAKIHHPDRNRGKDTTEAFQLVSEAFAVLGDVVQRQVYDDYIDYAEKLRAEPEVNPIRELAGRRRMKTVKKEKRTNIYFQGVCVAKYWGELTEGSLEGPQKEAFYSIHPTDVRVTLPASDIYREEEVPSHYQQAYRNASKFRIAIPQPVKCTILYDDGEQYYDLHIKDLVFQNPQIVDTSKQEQQRLGTLKADIYGTIVQIEEETLYEEATEGSGETGKVETKEEKGEEYIRREYYHKDFSTYWSPWQPTGTRRKRYAAGNEDLSWLAWLLLLPFVLLVPRFFLTLALVFLLLFVFSFLASRTYRLAGTGVIFLLLYLLWAGFTVFQRSGNVVKRRAQGYDSLNTTTTPVTDKEAPDGIRDNKVSHFIRWSGYDSTRFEGTFSLFASQLQRSETHHAAMNRPIRSAEDISGVYAAISHYDTAGLQMIYQAFQTIREENHLDERRFAEMIVSCIQSLPYYLVLDGSCNADAYPGDDYVRQYLSDCTQECCVGNKVYGFQSPLEFFGDLKGDCDTRALLLYNILDHFHFKAALLVSNYYRHALLAVHLTVPDDTGAGVYLDGDRYLLWETTAKGFGPGVIDPAYANMDNWQIVLLNKKQY